MKDDNFKLLRGFDNRQMYRQTDGQTFVNVELLYVTSTEAKPDLASKCDWHL